MGTATHIQCTAIHTFTVYCNTHTFSVLQCPGVCDYVVLDCNYLFHSFRFNKRKLHFQAYTNLKNQFLSHCKEYTEMHIPVCLVSRDTSYSYCKAAVRSFCCKMKGIQKTLQTPTTVQLGQLSWYG